MAFEVRAEITGLKEAIAALDSVDARLRKKTLRQAVSHAGKLVLQAAKAKVPRETGLLRRSLGRKIKVYRNTGAVVAIVGPRIGYRQLVTRSLQKRKPTDVYSDPIKYAHLVEKGTIRARAKPFLRPALEEQASLIVSSMSNIIAHAIEDSARGK